MIRTIIRRELLEHLASLQCASLFLLALLLMTLSASVFSARYARTVNEEALAGRRGRQGLVDDQGHTNLRSVPCEIQVLNREPLRLAFLSGAAEREIPDQMSIAAHSLGSLSRTVKAGETLDPPVPFDWSFLVSVIFSFAAGLLTYKSVSGELRDGTLTLTLSNPVPKAVLLFAKYLAALLLLAAVLTVSMLCGLFVLRLLGAVVLTPDDWLKVGLFWLTSLGYLSVFVLIGLLCSVLARTPLLSAAAFLLNWTILVFVIPNLGGVLSEFAGDVKTPHQVTAMRQALTSEYPLRNDMTMAEQAATVQQREHAGDALLLEHLQSLMHQVELGQNITRLSPSAVYLYAGEEITGSGLPRLAHFVRNVREYRERIFEAMLAADREDTASRHIYYPWNCGMNFFSSRLVDLGPAKEFHDPAPSGAASLETAGWDLLLLFLFNLLAFSVAFWSFVRQDAAPTPGV